MHKSQTMVRVLLTAMSALGVATTGCGNHDPGPTEGAAGPPRTTEQGVVPAPARVQALVPAQFGSGAAERLPASDHRRYLEGRIANLELQLASHDRMLQELSQASKTNADGAPPANELATGDRARTELATIVAARREELARLRAELGVDKP